MSFTLHALKQSVRPKARAFAVLIAALFVANLAPASARTDDQELKKFNQFVQSSDTPSMRLLREGRDLIDAEQWAKAAEKFSRFVSAYGKDKDVDVALFWLAHSLNKQGDPRGAASQLQILLKKYPQSAWADESRAMLNEIAAKLGETKINQNTLDDAKEDEEIKIVALHSLFEANPERAMAYIAGILKAGSTASPRMKQTAVSLLGSRGGPQAAAILLDIARTHPDAELRARAIHSIANEGGAATLDELVRLYDSDRDPKVKRQLLHAFSEMDENPRAHAKLMEIARNASENAELRRTAIHWIGERKTPGAFDNLVQLYNSEANVEIKRQIIHGFFDTEDARAFAKLVEIARDQKENVELRRQAVHWIGEKESAAAFDSLIQIYNAEQSVDLKRQILHAFSESKDPRALAKLLEIARNPSEAKDLRRQAVHWLGEQENDSMLDELMQLYESDKDTDLRRQILHAFSEMESPRARQKLVEAARTGSDVELRRTAIHWLGESKDPQTLEMLIGMYDAEQNVEVKRQLLHAFSESKQKRALQKLMDVARRDPNVELRKQAVHWIGESDDPDALRFLEELLKP